MSFFKFCQDEDGKWYEETEGQCQFCGEWSDERIDYYGHKICDACYRDAIGEEYEL